MRERHNWHALLATWLGGMFDGMDSSIFAIVLYPALSELLHTTSYSQVGVYGSYIIAMFMVGWAIGAVGFGIVADYIGRAKTLTITILVYALCTGLCALAHNWWELGIYRFLVGAGIGGELGIGAVLLSEVWPHKSRVFAVSAMSCSLGFGYLVTALLNLSLGGFGWRWLFLAGISPAFLTVYIRAKLKEPERFTQVNDQRKLLRLKAVTERSAEEQEFMRFTFWDLFNSQNLKKTIVATAITSCAVTTWWAVVSWIPAWVNQLTGTLAVEQRSFAMFGKEFGMIMSGICGSFVISKLGYKWCLGLTFLLAMLTSLGMFLTVKSFGPELIAWVMCVGFFAHLPFVVLWNYLPELFEARIRSTAFGFSYNIGRFVAAAAALLSGALIQLFAGSYALAASTVSLIYLFGMVAVFYMPETSGKVE